MSASSVKKSQSNDLLMSLILGSIIAGLLSFATYYLLDSKFNSLRSDVLSRTDVMMLDLDATVSNLIKDGMSAKGAILYTNTMMKVLKAKGVMVIDAKSVLSVPESAKIKLISKEDLYRIADTMGLSPTDAELREIDGAMHSTDKLLDLSEFR